MKLSDILKLPKQEDVTEFEMGDMNLTVISITPENKDAVAEKVLSMYLNDVCMYCHEGFTPEQLKDSIWAFPNEEGRIVHGECWRANN